MKEKKSSEEIENYFKDIEKEISNIYNIASKARKKNKDPEPNVDISIAKDMSERVIGLVSSVYPKILKTNIPKRIKELEEKYGVLDWRVSLIIAYEVASEKFCKFEDKIKAMEIGIRVGFAYHTLGTVSSPLEGFSKIEIGKRIDDDKEYIKVFFSGPIRSAGGTGASFCVMLSDYIRKKMGYASYDPSKEEIKRYIKEINDYHNKITNLQYLPSEEEIKFFASKLPVQISGDPSEKEEVSQEKGLKRVETDRIRNGVCLVFAEGLCQKAPKLLKQISSWGKNFDLQHWDFLEEFVNIQKRIKSGEKDNKNDNIDKENNKDQKKVLIDTTFIKDVVAGRPILTYPMREGGFRLRYGRSRTSGYSAASINPYTMKVLDDFIGIGTQLKVERPGKGCIVSSCDTIQGPIVLLENGSVIHIDSEKKYNEIKDKIIKILFLGDILFSYGDFLNRAHKLIPVGYCEEWWAQDLERAIVNTFGALDFDKASELLEQNKNEVEEVLKDPLRKKISAKTAITISKKLNVPLHPRFTYHYKDITTEEYLKLIQELNKAKIQRENNIIKKIVFSLEKEDKKNKENKTNNNIKNSLISQKETTENITAKKVLEKLGIPHEVINNEYFIIENDIALAFAKSFSFYDEFVFKNLKDAAKTKNNVLEIINSISDIKIRDKSGVYIGARMGRPEKAKLRKSPGSPHVIFPLGKEGGRLKSFQEASLKGKVTEFFSTFYCESCKTETIYPSCERCEEATKKIYNCNICRKESQTECSHKKESFKRKPIDINHFLNVSKNILNTEEFEETIKGIERLPSKSHIPENIIKGVLRKKHDLYVNKDGTIRYDMTQMPLTHFKPKEVGLSLKDLEKLGYKKDIKGKEITDEDQILEIKPLDIILPSPKTGTDHGADIVFKKVAMFCDELLDKMYGIKPYYNIKDYKDLIGHLGIILAPHTSAALAIRIIGFSKTQCLLAHPMVHAATRRDCDGDEASVMLLMDALLNFSRQYLPSHRGATQDAPLVMTTRLMPSEIDDMVFDMDISFKYPLDFYEACENFLDPWQVNIDKIKDKLSKESQYEGMGFTHDTSDINKGTACSSYKTLPSMEEKLKGQMILAEKIRAVDESDTARLIIQKHFLRDTKGNLKRFFKQEFRCIKCNEKYRRPPLSGSCRKCNGRLIFTVSKGSVIKYLQPSISLAKKYNIPPYLSQTLYLLKKDIQSIFGEEGQEDLGNWFKK